MNLLCANIEKSTGQDDDKHPFKHIGGSDKCCMESWGEKQRQKTIKIVRMAGFLNICF